MWAEIIELRMKVSRVCVYVQRPKQSIDFVLLTEGEGLGWGVGGRGYASVPI